MFLPDHFSITQFLTWKQDLCWLNCLWGITFLTCQFKMKCLYAFSHKGNMVGPKLVLSENVKDLDFTVVSTHWTTQAQKHIHTQRTLIYQENKNLVRYILAFFLSWTWYWTKSFQKSRLSLGSSVVLLSSTHIPPNLCPYKPYKYHSLFHFERIDNIVNHVTLGTCLQIMI